MRVAFALLIALWIASVYVVYRLGPEYIEKDPVCVPLYDQTGLECCK